MLPDWRKWGRAPWLELRRTTWLLVTVGLAARLVALAWIGNAPLVDDAADYHAMAVGLLHGGAVSTDWPPGVALWLLPFCAVLGSSAIVARAATLCWYGAMTAATFGVAARLGGRRAGNVALALLLVYPAHVLQAVLPLTQLPCAALLMTALYLALRATDGDLVARRWTLPLCGLALGAAVLVRPPSILCCAALPAVLALRTRRVRDAALPLALAAAVVSLWLVKVHDLAGRFVFINDANSQNFFYGNNEWTPLYRTWWFGSHKYPAEGVPLAYAEARAAISQLPPTARDQAFSGHAMAHIKARPELFVLRSLSRVRAYLAFDTYASSFLINRVGAPKLVGLGRHWRRRAALSVDRRAGVGLPVRPPRTTARRGPAECAVARRDHRGLLLGALLDLVLAPDVPLPDRPYPRRVRSAVRRVPHAARAPAHLRRRGGGARADSGRVGHRDVSARLSTKTSLGA